MINHKLSLHNLNNYHIVLMTKMKALIKDKIYLAQNLKLQTISQENPYNNAINNHI
jgi:hypothetical protein